MKQLLLVLLLVFALPGTGLAQPTDKSQYDAEYLKMVAAAHSMPADFDFKALRDIYPKTSFYSPFGEVAYKEALFKALDKAQLGDQTGLQEANRIVDEHFAHFKAHSYLMTFKGLSAEDQKLHVWAFKGIAGSIIDHHNASDPANAIKVLDVSEEYLLIRTIFHGKVTKQSVLNKDGKVFDVMSYTDDTGAEKQSYFDVSTPFAAYPTSLGK